jgi:predicted RNA-binding protein with PIN domain
MSAIVLVDAENVRRSVWPNLSREELVERVVRWAEREGVHAEVVFEGQGETADDRIVAEAAKLHEQGEEVWVATSDRELRERLKPYAKRIIGGGTLARTLTRT